MLTLITWESPLWTYFLALLLRRNHVTKRLLIIGAGGHGKVVADCAELANCYCEIAFLDSGFPTVKQATAWPVIGNSQDFSLFVGPDTCFFVAVGDNDARAKLIARLQAASGKLATLIHPSAVISRYVDVGEGTLVCANATINVASKIGRGCIINTAASVDHDCHLEDHVHLAPGTRLAGNITIGEGTFVGIGSSIIPDIVLGKYCILGAGSALLEDLPNYSVAVGMPAKVIKQRKPSF
jgi:sugar O-acyltransferase (sialic acid O-acetyltransferase NeuD family)